MFLFFLPICECLFCSCVYLAPHEGLLYVFNCVFAAFLFYYTTHTHAHRRKQWPTDNFSGKSMSSQSHFCETSRCVRSENNSTRPLLILRHRSHRHTHVNGKRPLSVCGYFGQNASMCVRLRFVGPKLCRCRQGKSHQIEPRLSAQNPPE